MSLNYSINQAGTVAKMQCKQGSLNTTTTELTQFGSAVYTQYVSEYCMKHQCFPYLMRWPCEIASVNPNACNKMLNIIWSTYMWKVRWAVFDGKGNYSACANTLIIVIAPNMPSVLVLSALPTFRRQYKSRYSYNFFVIHVCIWYNSTTQ